MVDLSFEIKNQLNDKDFRKKIRANPKEVLAEFAEVSGWTPDEDTEFVVVNNTKDTSYVAIPYYKSDLDNGLLASVSAARVHDSCLSTIGTLCGTLLSLSTIAPTA